MERILKELVFVLPVTVFSILLLFFCLNLYLKIRRQFPVKVNCWFCNVWTKVSYDEQNCFECPSCLQYNGFDSSGSYNKIIPAQHDKLLNKSIPKRGIANSTYSNGLCHICNNNQQLKIFQLANFIPLRENEYDIEIEHFGKQLEKAYKLCPKCENVVKTTIHKQNLAYGLKFSNLRKKGLDLLDLNKSSNGISKEMKLKFLKRTFHFLLLTFAVLNLLNVIVNVDYRTVEKFIPKWCKNWYLKLSILASYYYFNFNKTTGFDKILVESMNLQKTLKLTAVSNTISYFNSTYFGEIVEPYISSIQVPDNFYKNEIFLGFVGTFLQFILFFCNDNYSFRKKIFQFLIWSLITSVYWINLSIFDLSNYLSAVQFTASLFIIYTMCSSNVIRNKKRKVKNVLKHLKKQPTAPILVDDYSDNEELIPNWNTFRNSTSSFDISSKSLSNKIQNCEPIFGQSPVFENSLSKGSYSKNQFLTARTAASRTSIDDPMTLFNESPTYRSKSLENTDIDEILDRLHLSSPTCKKRSSNIFATNKSRPILSPPKLKNITQNSWVAGGFWLDSNGVPFPSNNLSNSSPLSRSSSQTSGFISQNGQNEPLMNSFQASQNNSVCGDYESVVSEPAYSVSGKNLFNNFPIINHEHYVYVAPSYNFAHQNFIPISNENLTVGAFRIPRSGETTNLFTPITSIKQ